MLLSKRVKMAGRLRCHMRGRSFHLNVWGLVVPVTIYER